MSEAPPSPIAAQAHPVQRLDYRPPDWLVPTLRLAFDLDADLTTVAATLNVERNGAHQAPLRLDGEGLTLVSLAIDGEAIADPQSLLAADGGLSIPLPSDRHCIETVVAIAPAANSQLMGLYASGGLLCTQCEAEGFRRITFFPDRPDVLSVYTVRMTADQARFPVLLANGDPVISGEDAGGRHWAEWHDPWPKPCYLFALVAGNLVANRDHFVTKSGRTVALAIWVRAPDLPRTTHAMHALKLSMRWDEEAYGREYDLDRFNIVAVDDFNFGAMENKGLNIFNARYILADPQSATDQDFDNILGIVAHEYFHNWSGNRVTCRDWFQLSLKEGFTVFRDQQFSADQGSAAVKRIEDVRTLRAHQFPEDAGPLAHPIRPESYMEISNFYTATVYNKGAEVIRMMHTLLGPERFRAGTDLYFDRHDGQAATCDDFVQAMEDGGQMDLERFRRWYSTAGTPHVTMRQTHSGDTATLTLSQSLGQSLGQSAKGKPLGPDRALVLPLRFALFDRVSGARRHEGLITFDGSQETDATLNLSFPGWSTPPIVSINRGFSAPITLDSGQSADDLAFLSAHDDDPFARYEALQQLMFSSLTASAGRLASGGTESAVADGALVEDVPDDSVLIEAVGRTLAEEALDPALIAEAIILPSEASIGDRMTRVDPDAIGTARDRLRAAIGRAYATAFRARYAAIPNAPYAYTPKAKGMRRLRLVFLSYLAAADPDEGVALAQAQLDAADNMTDTLSALAALIQVGGPACEAALAGFYDRWRDDALVLNKWFSLQAMAPGRDTVERVQALTTHPDFTLANPNRFHALVGAFCANTRAFHRADGAGYQLVTEQILALDPINPQTAARSLPPLGRWRRYDPGRQALMKACLARIVEQSGLSRDVFEQASKSLNG